MLIKGGCVGEIILTAGFNLADLWSDICLKQLFEFGKQTILHHQLLGHELMQ